MNDRRWVWLGALLISLAALGCGGEDGNGETTTVSRDTYPSGPYGTDQGATIDDFKFVDSAGGDYALGDVFADSSNKLLLLVFSAGWCTACIEEQPTIKQWASTHGAHGLSVLMALIEDETYTQATAEYAASWKTQYDLSFSVVADTNGVIDQFGDSSLLPVNVLIDVDTMQVLNVFVGGSLESIEAVINAKL